MDLSALRILGKLLSIAYLSLGRGGIFFLVNCAFEVHITVFYQKKVHITLHWSGMCSYKYLPRL